MITPRLTLAFLCAVFLLPGIAATAQSAISPEDRVGIQAAYDGINSAFVQHDLGRFMAYFAPDYVSVDQSGEKRCKDQERHYYQDLLGRIKSMQSRFSIQRLTPTPSGTLVEVAMHSDGIGEKRILFAKLHASFTNDVAVRDLWVDTPEGWRLKSRQTLSNQTHIHPG